MIFDFYEQLFFVNQSLENMGQVRFVILESRNIFYKWIMKRRITKKTKSRSQKNDTFEKNGSSNEYLFCMFRDPDCTHNNHRITKHTK